MQNQPSGVYDAETMLGDKDKKFKPDDLFLRNTLPGAAKDEGSPEYVEPPDEEGAHCITCTPCNWL